VLREVLNQTNKEFYYEAKDEAAFYGPKIDVQINNIAGKEETAFTVQYDFVMPKRFEMRFINEKGIEEEPVVVHRSSLGAFERTMAFLIEKYAGNFPTWLNPVQVKVLPIADRHIDYAQSVVNQLKNAHIRTELDERKETLQAKIRDAQMEKVSYMFIIGDKETESNTVAKRGRSGKDYGKQSINQCIADIKKEIDEHLIA
jgi:threonyl-tRNA synthetase